MSSTFYISSAGHYWQYRAENKTIHMHNKLRPSGVLISLHVTSIQIFKPGDECKMGILFSYPSRNQYLFPIYNLGRLDCWCKGSAWQGCPPSKRVKTYPSKKFCISFVSLYSKPRQRLVSTCDCTARSQWTAQYCLLVVS